MILTAEELQGSIISNCLERGLISVTHLTVIPVKTKSQAQGAWAKNPGKKKKPGSITYSTISYHIPRFK